MTLEGIDVAAVGFLNGTYQQFDYDTTFPWGLQMGFDDDYAGTCLYVHCKSKMTDETNLAWQFALIDTEYGDEGFYFNTSGLQWNETEGGFNGWLGTL